MMSGMRRRERGGRRASPWLAVAAASILGPSLLVTAGVASAAFPGQNGRIAFVRNETGASPALWVMNADGSSPTSLSSGLADVNDPSWSPDGTRVLFEAQGRIFLQGLDGTCPPVGLRKGSNPSWSPDGTKIAFSRATDFFFSGDGPSQIFVMNADGSGLEQITDSPFGSGEPAWSPSGDRIAFTRSGGIYVIGPDGSGETALTNDPTTDDEGPAWSPDGTKIAFDRYDGEEYQIYVMNADGSEQVALTDQSGPNPEITNVNPAWSPDGTKITFTSYRDGNAEIYVMIADGSQETRLTDFARLDDEADWQPLVDGGGSAPETPGIFVRDSALEEPAPGTVATFQLTIGLCTPSDETVAVHWSTEDRTATSPADYLAKPTTVSFPPGVTTRVVKGKVYGDRLTEDWEDFFVNLDSPTNGWILDAVATTTIVDYQGS